MEAGLWDGKGVGKMRRNGWIVFLVLLCVAFLVSCGKNAEVDVEDGELVRIETGWENHPVKKTKFEKYIV